jgi:hypothetical protein
MSRRKELYLAKKRQNLILLQISIALLIKIFGKQETRLERFIKFFKQQGYSNPKTSPSPVFFRKL